MNLTSEDIENKIKSALPDAVIKAQDLTGTGDHWNVSVASASFKDLSLVKQHRLVYEALGDWMKKDIHAIALDTKEL